MNSKYSFFSTKVRTDFTSMIFYILVVLPHLRCFVHQKEALISCKLHFSVFFKYLFLTFNIFFYTKSSQQIIQSVCLRASFSLQKFSVVPSWIQYQCFTQCCFFLICFDLYSWECWKLNMLKHCGLPSNSPTWHIWLF